MDTRPDDTPTATLKRVSPQWAWIRENFTLGKVIWLGTGVIAIIYGWADIKHNVSQLQADVASLTVAVKNQPDHGAEIAALRQQVTDLKEQVAEHQRWKERVECVAEKHGRASGC